MTRPRRYRAVLPIINDDFITYPGHPWWIANDLRVGTLSEEEARLISEGVPRDFEHRIDSGQKCLHLIGLTDGIYERVKKDHVSTIQLVAMCAQVAFNLISKRHAMVIPYAVVICESVAAHVKDVYEFEIWGNPLSLRRQPYRIKSNIEKAELQHLFDISRKVLTKSQPLRITVNRFCSALLKTNSEDKLIDLTIALESLIPGGGEFGFRFPYYLSLLVDQDPSRRKEAYFCLKALYNARSGLVHGASDKGKDKDLRGSLSNWSNLVTYAKQCIIYKLEFDHSHPTKKWEDHLLDLAYAGVPIMNLSF